MKSLCTWTFILRNLEKKIPVTLLFVLESKGSSPGRQGFLMAVNEPGEMEGSIGGGIMEHKFVEMAKAMMLDHSGLRGSGIRKQVHDKAAAKNQSGMICSGEQTIFIYPVREIDTTSIAAMVTSLQQNKNGSFTLSPAGIAFSDTPAAEDYAFNFQSDENWRYVEKTGFKNQLFIIGGGHCSLALSQLMSTMDFYIHVIDDRDHLKTMEENQSAHEKYIVENYAEVGNLVSPGTNHYVVVMTFGYRTDAIVIRSLAGKSFKYLGVLGSRNKIRQLFEEFINEGIPTDFLDEVHAPIGLHIHSQTPEEIAVSIAAEIVGVKNGSSSIEQQ